MAAMRRPLVAILIAALGGVGCAPTPTGTEPELVVISVMGTNDVHGELMPQSNHGGLVTFSGYVAALRDARAKDGAVLLVDAGDMWQGTLESNLTEGATVAEAYNALGYAAATIGNHEFDFGPAGPKAIPEFIDDDPQGALKERASELNFPLLAANLIDTTSDQRVDWDNVLPSTMVTRAGIKIGIVGLVTTSALRTTIASNTIGVHIAPLAEAATTEARALRAAGASLVVVIAHAGSRCEEFTDPLDLSSCEMSGEIMRVANAIPSGLVDHIVAGHVHRGIAHVVNGIAITASYSRTSAFSRVDFTLDRDGNIVDRRIYPPQSNCARAPDEGGRCAYEGDSARERATYEGRVVLPMPAVAAITARASDVVAELQAEKIGVFLETAMTLREQPETVLGNLLTDAVLASNDADISIHNVYGGIRAELPQGDMTFGDVYRVFPFDDRVAIIELSGRDVRKIIANQVHNNGRRAGFSGMRVFVVCNAGKMRRRE
jgi:5'-nucleotidase